MSVRKILVLLDFSEGSAAALQDAQAIAQAAGAELVLLHVVDERPSLQARLGGYLPTYDRVALDRTLGATLEAWASGCERAGLRVQRRLVHGFPEQAIHATTAECAPDLVVMGTHGQGGLEHVSLGSLASRVVRTSKVPVLAVPTPSRS